MKSSWITQWVLNSKTGSLFVCLIVNYKRQQRRDRYTEREDDVKMEAGIGVMCL